ncbi:MAG: hypothetical protein L0H83_05570 [Salinisphaera sp.]|nr:hypothetical protein [Salinisphaera sp.]
MSTVSERWWNYIQREGNHLGVKAFDVAVGAEGLAGLIAEPLDDDKLDALIQHMGRAFKPEITRRSAFTSELFPMLPYMSLSVIDDFHTYADRVATMDAAMPAQEIAARLRRAPGQVSPLWVWMAGYHYLSGRECLIQMGRLRRDERIEDIRTVVDFWRRLALALRGDGTLDNKDAAFTNRYLPPDSVDELLGQTSPLDRSSAKALKRLNATAAGYSFLYFCDSRVGVCDSGPYPQAGGRHTIVRDYLCLGPSTFAYSWAKDLQPPVDGLTLVLTYDPAAFSAFEINDWGTTFTEPDPLLSAVTEAAVMGHRDGKQIALAPADWPEITVALSKEHMTLYQVIAEMDRGQRIFTATQMYTAGLRPFAAVAGVTDQIDWSFSSDTLALYPDPLDDDEKAAAVFGNALVANELPGAFSGLF